MKLYFKPSWSMLSFGLLLFMVFFWVVFNIVNYNLGRTFISYEEVYVGDVIVRGKTIYMVSGWNDLLPCIYLGIFFYVFIFLSAFWDTNIKIWRS